MTELSGLVMSLLRVYRLKVKTACSGLLQHCLACTYAQVLLPISRRDPFLRPSNLPKEGIGIKIPHAPECKPPGSNFRLFPLPFCVRVWHPSSREMEETQ